MATDCLVFEYDPINDAWNVLPPSPVTLFGIGEMFGELVLVGGKNNESKATSDVHVFNRNPQMWKQSIPPMNHARYSPAVVSHQSSILACGGFAESQSGDVHVVTNIEVITTEGYRWYVAGYLPHSASLAMCSCVTIHDNCYIVGGYRSSTAVSASQSTHHSSLSCLLSNSCLTPYTWKALPDTPHLQTTTASLGGCLLALGGTSSPYSLPAHRSLHAYSPNTNSWIYVGDLPYASCHCSAISLPSGELLVVGGWLEPGQGKRSSAVYRGRIMR